MACPSRPCQVKRCQTQSRGPCLRSRAPPTSFLWPVKEHVRLVPLRSHAAITVELLLARGANSGSFVLMQLCSAVDATSSTRTRMRLLLLSPCSCPPPPRLMDISAPLPLPFLAPGVPATFRSRTCSAERRTKLNAGSVMRRGRSAGMHLPLTKIRRYVIAATTLSLMATPRICVKGRSCTRCALHASPGTNSSLAFIALSKVLVAAVQPSRHRTPLSILLDTDAIWEPSTPMPTMGHCWPAYISSPLPGRTRPFSGFRRMCAPRPAKYSPVF